MQGFFGVYGFLIFCMIYCWFPETSQPGSRGIDKMRAESGGNSKDHFYFINPLRPLLLLRSPNLFLIVSTRWLHVEIVPNDLVLTIPMSQSIILSSSLLSFFGTFIFPFSYVNRSDKMKLVLVVPIAYTIVCLYHFSQRFRNLMSERVLAIILLTGRWSGPASFLLVSGPFVII